ncbi:GNAT family N-acetyltransferase [Streptomyces yangpuensis]|uniref:GNAT family N-acetyltransferase n=1 Tax=Streptomyces yangpuensis TaxID=1648182 RepID=A0ABY5Q363_9ACTN|nr:GNAT family N-acetyltransferase [Streptomyces yangpuensis]MBZ9598663.1 GNAT family N-acetyltransferase [Streptomyces erythrochromogenes]UUY50443.1 GNAT family N-acetyltransferase [Streptomyces yangpuensis]
MTEAPWRIETDPDRVACADLLAAAFAREPAVTWICGGSASARTHWFRNTLRTHAGLAGARRTALVDADGRLLAAAVLTPPGATPTAGARALWAARTLLRPGPRALGRTLRYLDTTEGCAPTGAWTLEFIGVSPARTGRGVGRALLDHVLSAVPAGTGTYLTTADPSNVPLYHHFGFTTLHEARLGPLPVTAMTRAPTPLR